VNGGDVEVVVVGIGRGNILLIDGGNFDVSRPSVQRVDFAPKIK
jgi:hypothetical protein